MLPSRRASLTGRRASNASNASNASAAADAVAAAAAAADAERQRRGRRKPAAGDRYAANGAQSAVRRVESRRGGLDATRLGMLQDPRMRTTLKNILQTYHLDFMARLDQSRVAYTLHSVFVILAALAFCLETMVELQPIVPSNVWVFAEMVFTVFFTVELLARYVASRRSRSTFWSDPLIWVDIVSIVPFYTILLACRGDPFSQCSVRDAWYIRWLQAVKILRIFKISRHFSGTRVLVKAMRESKRALGAPVVMLLLSVTMFASVLFFLESGQWDPDNEVYAMEDGSSPLMVSIVNTGYFVVVTMTTVGYGDQYPLTTMGKLVTCGIMLFGVLFSAMPLAIVGNSFYDAIESEEEENDARAAKKKLLEEVQPSEFDFETISSRYVVLGSVTYSLRTDVRRLSAAATANPNLRVVDRVHLRSLLFMWVNRYTSFFRVMRSLTDLDPLPKRIEDAVVGAGSRAAEEETKRTILSHPRLRDSPRRRWLYEVLEMPDDSELLAARVMYWSIVVGVTVSLLTFVVQTMTELQEGAARELSETVFGFLDTLLNAFFTIEFLLRVVVAPDKVAFCKDVYNVFDFIAILPWYLETLFGVDFLLLRLARMLRVFKVSKNLNGTAILAEALRTSYRPLLIPLYFLFVFTFVFATLLYLVESGTEAVGFDGQVVQHVNGVPSEINDVFRAAYIILVTMTSVGYGDVTPVTLWGKGVAMIAMLFGIVYLAMPIAIVGTNFYKAYEAEQNKGVVQQKRAIRVDLLHVHRPPLRAAMAAAKRLALQLAKLDAALLREDAVSHRDGSVLATPHTLARPEPPASEHKAALLEPPSQKKALLPPLAAGAPEPATPGFVKLPTKPLGSAKSLPPLRASSRVVPLHAPDSASQEAKASAAGHPPASGAAAGAPTESKEAPATRIAVPTTPDGGVANMLAFAGGDDDDGDDGNGAASGNVVAVLADLVDDYMEQHMAIAHVLHHIRIGLHTELDQAERSELMLATALPSGGSSAWRAMKTVLEQRRNRANVM